VRHQAGARCAPCAEVYRADAYQLLRAGLVGGKGLPDTVAAHPRLLVTFTAPSFGPVHSTRVRHGRVQVCHPARPEARCPHGRRRRCAIRHLPGDPLLGVPLCPACYDYQRAVIWNALAPELWRRTSIYLRRTLARAAGLTAAEGRRLVRPALAKVAEYQARGAAHLHAIIRLDAAHPRMIRIGSLRRRQGSPSSCWRRRSSRRPPRSPCPARPAGHR
jgi:Replication initiator protein, pSAM2